MKDSRWSKKIDHWTPHGRRRRGRPQQTWRNQVTGLHEKQKHGRRYGRGQISWAFGSGWTTFVCIVSDNKNYYYKNYYIMGR